MHSGAEERLATVIEYQVDDNNIFCGCTHRVYHTCYLTLIFPILLISSS
jgi:hypothetical protein